MGRQLTLSDLFPRPPFQPPARMDALAEQLITDQMLRKYGEVSTPVPTDALACLLEREARELDLYADLSDRGDGVEGMTEFQVGLKPIVRISAHLSNGQSDYRFRSTIAHEFGHVRLHDALVQRHSQQGSLLQLDDTVFHCAHRNSGHPGTNGSLVEYQAWYFGGALLMPKSRVIALVSTQLDQIGSYAEVCQDSPVGLHLQDVMAKTFNVSRAIARIRLLKLGCLTESEPAPALF